MPAAGNPTHITQIRTAILCHVICAESCQFMTASWLAASGVHECSLLRRSPWYKAAKRLSRRSQGERSNAEPKPNPKNITKRSRSAPLPLGIARVLEFFAN
ncbi:hypothetical protein OPV22_022086 [Ensete ventricosum]|uniref:Uncharacterized protein n=1 Tax=Ensete ventricosum TaxID=4639 RepID=A0AAV8QTH7_ENSVE|nr:hypothetical protein OPV22_022086 [Ensete ventricosum]